MIMSPRGRPGPASNFPASAENRQLWRGLPQIELVPATLADEPPVRSGTGIRIQNRDYFWLTILTNRIQYALPVVVDHKVQINIHAIAAITKQGARVATDIVIEPVLRLDTRFTRVAINIRDNHTVSRRHGIDVIEAIKCAERRIQICTNWSNTPDLEKPITKKVQSLLRNQAVTNLSEASRNDERCLPEFVVNHPEDGRLQIPRRILLELTELTFVRSAEGSTRAAEADLEVEPGGGGRDRAFPRSLVGEEEYVQDGFTSPSFGHSE